MAEKINAELLDGILKKTIPALFRELVDCDWYIREHEVVNLFVFGHLVPAFLACGLDLTLIGIESPVLQVERNSRSKLGARKDLVIWREPRTTRFKGCKVTRPLNNAFLRKEGCKPLAVLEWKNISRITARPGGVEADHLSDIEWLRVNLHEHMFDIGYAILVDQTCSPSLTCRRLSASTEIEFLALPQATEAKDRHVSSGMSRWSGAAGNQGLR